MVILHKYLRYCLKTGQFFWKPRARDEFTSDRVWNTWNSRYSGRQAGTVNSKGYIKFKVKGKHYAAHRVAWYFYTGDWPDQIDHINGNKQDNRLTNIRNVSNIENQRNKSLGINNTSGYLGISAYRNKWRAQIYVKGKLTLLGDFLKLSSAVEARKQAEMEQDYHANHGRKR